MSELVGAILIWLVLTSGCDQSPGGQPSIQPSPASNNTPQDLAEKQVGSVLLKQATVLDDKLSLLIPDGFSEMDEELLRTKYPNARRPPLVYTNEAGTINIAINHTRNRLTPAELPQLHEQMDATIRQQHPDANWTFSGLQDHHERKWMQLEFESQALDTTIHNIMVATSVDGRMLLVSFNVTDELSADWLEPGREIIKSLVVAD